jgi:Tfp pilus assembly protein PilF
MTFWNELKRRKVVRVAVAYLIVGWLLIQIADEEAAIRSTTDSVDAFDHYLRGREQYHRTDSGHLDRARQEFEKALEIDPDYALAWAGLTYVFVDTYWYADKEPMYIDMAHDASKKAVELAPHLAESHAAP